MILNLNHQVPLPERGIIKYKSKETTYVYHINRIYRNEKDSSTNNRVSIGKFDNETGMLIPNNNYYEIFSSSNSKPKQPEIESIESCGVTYVVDGLLNELGLIEIIRKKFPKHADQIIHSLNTCSAKAT